jgi:energy-coupling factor transporter ATP-binding protein EcfA2
MNTALIFEQFSFRYSPQAPVVLSEISFHLPEHSVCAILGTTSSGKSTLLQIVAGIAGRHHASAESSGAVVLCKVHEQGTVPREVLFPDVGLVMQDSSVMLSGMYETVEEEIALTLRNLGCTPSDMDQRVREVMRTLRIEHLTHRHPQHLSGGELQRVALATILVARPQLLLLDEPRNSLDCAGIDALAVILHSLKGSSTILFSDYQCDLALTTADYILVLDRGKQIFFGTRSEFITRLAEFCPRVVQKDWVDLFELAATEPPRRHLHNLFQKLGYPHAPL